jgi:RNA polymerase sigma-70 factor (ECF subfamily)
MEDEKIVDLYWSRNEDAIRHTAERYGQYCYAIAYNILSVREDSEECVNDTYLDAWNSMPPHRPTVLSAFLGKITRRIAIDRWRQSHAQKRGGGEMALALDELSECVASTGDVAREAETLEVAAAVQKFLNTLPDIERRVFVRRYWHMESIADLAAHFGCGQSRIKSMLHRTRGKLQKHLREEGLV